MDRFWYGSQDQVLLWHMSWNGYTDSCLGGKAESSIYPDALTVLRSRKCRAIDTIL